MLRLAHVSDVHLFVPEAKWSRGDYMTRRLSGWLNVKLGRRGSQFRGAAGILALLVADVYERKPDLLIFSGDASSLGFEEELALTATLLRANEPDGIPLFAVPGNHDYYTRKSMQLGLFERYFASGLSGERLDGAIYPFARKVGPLYLIGLNSSTGNRWFWDATGRVGEEQRQRLQRLLAQPHIASSPRVLVTHFPVGLPNGKAEKPWHKLLDLKPTLQVAVEGGVSLWLHGHRHCAYYLPATISVPLPSICAGSGTQRELWTYNEYLYDGEIWQVQRRQFDPLEKRFRTVEQFDVTIAGPQSSVFSSPSSVSV
jgi:3',5'-cyclic AMP phosphodiesterase CpdA